MQKFETVKLADSKPEQRREFAQRWLGVSVDGLTDDEVLAKITASHEGDTIFLEKDAPPVDQTGSPPPKPGEIQGGGIVGSLGRGDPKVRIVVHAEERDGVVDNRHLPVGVNGMVWLLKRGEEITIPYRVFEALNNAERHVITMTKDGEQREQRVKNSPFNIVHMPPAEEIAAWHERVDQLHLP